MIIFAAFVLGFALGWYRATKRDGNRLDCLQYGVGHAIAFALLAMALVVLAGRLGLG